VTAPADLHPSGRDRADDTAVVGVGVGVGGPRWFGPPAAPLAGWVQAPSCPGLRGAVVLCRPLFGEDTVADPAFRHLAQKLTAVGLWVVRFDYAGTGDSWDPVGRGASVGDWLDSVDAALSLARRCTSGPVALCGLRMGGLLAAAAAARHREEVDAVAVWDPCPSGRVFLRHQRALQAGRFTGEPTPGTVEVPGYVLDGTLAEEIADLSLPSTLPVGRALLLARPGAGDVDLAVEHGGDVVRADRAWTVAGEQEALLEVDPLVSRLPLATVDRLGGWLGETMATLDGTAGAAGVPGVPEAPDSDRTGPIGGVSERFVTLGPFGLSGVETVPAGTGTSASSGAGGEPGTVAGGTTAGGKVVVFLSSGVDRHTGPSRLWVTLARRWAASGVRCVRADLSGLGESPPRPGEAAGVLRSPVAFDDVVDVANAVATGPEDVVLVGLCSGAYQALESALEMAPLGVLAVNPLLRFVPPELVTEGAVHPRRRICIPRRPWLGTVRAKVPAEVAAPIGAARSRWAARRGRRGAAGGWLDELVRSGVDVYCICGDQEAQVLRSAGAMPTGPPRTPVGVRIEVVPTLDHALLPAAHRDLVCDRLTEELHRMLGR